MKKVVVGVAVAAGAQEAMLYSSTAQLQLQENVTVAAKRIGKKKGLATVEVQPVTTTAYSPGFAGQLTSLVSGPVRAV